MQNIIDGQTKYLEHLAVHKATLKDYYDKKACLEVSKTFDHLVESFNNDIESYNSSAISEIEEP